MLVKTLREEVLEANLELVRRGLVLYAFGNPINAESRPLARELHDKHFLGRHGRNASYGQVKPT